MRKLFIIMLTLLLSMTILAQQSEAAGTLAGTQITNQAYGDSNDANGNQLPRVYSNKVTITVSQVAAIAILPDSISSTALLKGKVYYLVQLFNNGNAPDFLKFTLSSSGWTPASIRIWHDVDNSHSYTGGDVVLNPVNGVYTTNVQVPVDDDYDVILEVNVPETGINDGSNSTITITGSSAFDPAKTAIATYTTTVVAAAITAVKSHTPEGNPTKVKPGDTVTYTVTLTNTGSISATGVTVTDQLPSKITYTAGSLRVSINGGPFQPRTDAADGDGIKYDPATRTISTADSSTFTIGAGQSYALRFDTTVNAGVQLDTTIVNQATINYLSGSYAARITTNGDTVFVDAAPGVSITSTAMPKSGNPGDTVYYAFTVTNTGNIYDIIDLAVSSTLGWTWKIWVDVNGDGVPSSHGSDDEHSDTEHNLYPYNNEHRSGSDFIMVDSNLNGKVDTGNLDRNGYITLLVVATIPKGSVNGAVDVVTITANSAADPTKTAIQSFTTTVTAPVLTITKEIANVKAPVSGADCTPADPATGLPCKIHPGATLTYNVTATNSGGGKATSVVLTDITPPFMTYKTGSLKTGSTVTTLTTRSDKSDADGAQYNAGTRSIIVPDGNSINLGPNGTWIVQYQMVVQ